MRCVECHWWRDGVCRKHPPKVVVISSTNPYNNDELVTSTEWPATYKDDYCGEFERNKNENTEVNS